MAARRVLRAGGRHIDREHVGFIGLGSIGLATLRLLLQCLPHPAAITLCDVYAKRDLVREVVQQLSGDLGFRGALRVLESKASVPSDFYEATLVVGATNVPDILDVPS